MNSGDRPAFAPAALPPGAKCDEAKQIRPRRGASGNGASRIRAGLLALQGDFALHRQAIEMSGHDAREVRTVDDLNRVDCLIMPGGESTTMRLLMEASGFYEAIPRFAESRPVMGTCAGLVLLAQDVDAKSGRRTLGLIDCDVRRNAYGRQYHSFREEGRVCLGARERSFEMVFIRAPRIIRMGPDVEILGRLGEEPTMIRQGNVLAMSFHPEVSGDPSIHQFFLSLV